MKKNVSRTEGDAATVSFLAKDTKADSLRTAKAVALYGKAARHPVCQAGLRLWQLETDISKLAGDAALLEVEVLNSAEQQKKQVIKLYRETRNTKVAAEASLRLGKIKALLSKGRACYDAMVKYAAFLLQLERYASVRFEREYKAADAPARKPLREVKKRWKENPDGPSSLEHKILKILQDKVVSGAGAKGGSVAAYWEVGSSGKRALRDEFFQGRLTAREIHARLVAAGVLDGTETKRLAELHEIRRVADRLGIRPAEDQRGRKWKPYQAKEKPKRPAGRPRIKPELIYTPYIENFSADQGARDFQLVESDQFVESDQLVEASSFNEAYQFVVDDWEKAGKANQGQRAALGRFRENGLWNNYEARLGRELNKPVYLPANPEGWWLPLTAEQRARVPYFASFQELKRWMDNKKRASLPCLVGSFARIEKLRRWLATEPARDSILFWKQWLTRGVKMPKTLPVGILELKMEFLHKGKRMAKLVWIKTKNNTSLREVQPNKESAYPLGGSREYH